MDKKNTLIGISLLLAAGFLMFYQAQQAAKHQPPPPVETTAPEQPTQTGPHTAPSIVETTPLQPAITRGPAQLETNGSHGDELVVIRENEFMEVRFTNYGGAINDVALKRFEATKGSEDPYLMNGLRFAPALELSNFAGADKNTAYEYVDEGDLNSVAFRTNVNDQLEITRRYRISQDPNDEQPYLIRHELEFRNLTDRPLATGQFNLNIGTAAPTGEQDAYLLTFGYYDGEDTDFIQQSKYTGGGFLFFKSDPRDYIAEDRRLEWVSVKNQFFISILTPDTNGVGYFSQPVQFPIQEGETRPPIGITASLKMEQLVLPANGSDVVGFNYYIGPKEHGRISKMDRFQEKAMQFGFFGVISKALLLLMNKLNGFVDNYGVSIILLTLLVRTVLLPINLVSSRSMKRMGKMAEPMKLLKEKFPDNQQKQQQMMMELYKLNKINPVAGCLPLIMQIPIFFALFYMLRGAAELRFAEFLYIGDLSRADTIAYIFGLPLNILPFFYTITLVIQMRMTPTPTVDNAQAKMMKFMPFIFFPIIYTFASGLVLYWTASNLFTIGQQWMINRKQDDFEVQLPPSLKKAMEAPKKKGKRAKKAK